MKKAIPLTPLTESKPRTTPSGIPLHLCTGKCMIIPLNAPVSAETNQIGCMGRIMCTVSVSNTVFRFPTAAITADQTAPHTETNMKCCRTIKRIYSTLRSLMDIRTVAAWPQAKKPTPVILPRSSLSGRLPSVFAPRRQN